MSEDNEARYRQQFECVSGSSSPQEKIDNHLQWVECSRKKIFDCSIFNVIKVNRRSASDQTGWFVVLDIPDWVTVIPVVKDHLGNRCFLMVRQFRQGSGTVTLEFPAGVIEPDENPIEAAKRELEEETGYRAARIIPVGNVNPNPAFMNNSCHTFLAQQLAPVGEKKLDDLELLDVEIIPVPIVERDMGTGPFINGIMVMSLAQYWQWEKGADRTRTDE